MRSAPVKLSFLTRISWRALILAWLAFMTGSLASDGLKGDALFVMWWRPLGQYQGLITALVCLVFIIADFRSRKLPHNGQGQGDSQTTGRWRNPGIGRPPLSRAASRRIGWCARLSKR